MCSQSGGVAGLCLVVAFGAFAFTVLPPALRELDARATAYAGIWLLHFDHRLLPRGSQTAGDLAQMVMEQNRGKLARA